MDFNEKLQELRKQKGLTQEELSEALFVSRTAISKWESGRGYPNIDSLKQIAKFFSVTIDELLSGDEVLTVAEADSKEKEMHFCDLVFGLLDISVLLFFFLPLFGQTAEDVLQAVSLISLTRIATFLKTVYIAVIFGMSAMGILTLALQNYSGIFWRKSKRVLSLFFNAAGTLLFIMSRQPYAGVFLFVFLMIKMILLLKRR